MLNKEKIYLFGRIQSSVIGSQLYSDTSICEVSICHNQNEP